MTSPNPTTTFPGLPQGMAGVPLNPDGSINVEAYNRSIAVLQDLMRQTSGLQRRQIEAQLDDMVQARNNAMRIAEINDRTTRYGIDERTKVELAQLQQRQREFDATHALDVQRLGLDRAKTATDFLSSPDRFAQAGNYLALSGRVLADQPGAGTYGSAVTPRGNTEADFAVLESGGNPYGSRGSAMQAATAGGGAGTDARVKALKALNDVPVSDGPGMDANDYAVLKATAAIRGMNLTPQQQATINSDPEYTAILGSNLRRLGETPESWFKRQRQHLPGQQSARLA